MDLSKVGWTGAFRSGAFRRRATFAGAPLLDAIEGLRGKTVTVQDEETWNRQLELCGIGDWKDQLHMHLTQYTVEGSRAALTVRGRGPDKACGAWSKLADIGLADKLPQRVEGGHVPEKRHAE